MKRWLFSINLIICILLSPSCSNLGGRNTKSTKPTIPGGQSTGQKKTGDSSSPIVMPEPPNDSSILVTPPVQIKHGSPDQEKLDSLKRANLKKKKGG